ncbi:MAG: sugar kinase [Cyanobacteria bacterium P01_G01_bin.39]
MQYRGLFVGLVTLDLLYKSDRSLAKNKKIVAQDYLTVGGGPATNAAVAFSYLGNRSKLITVLGKHPVTQLIRNDLTHYDLEIVDLIPDKSDPPAVSSIIVDTTTGERGVVSLNAIKYQADNLIDPDLLADIDLVLIDGHQLETSLAIAKMVQSKRIPIVMDGGSWKPNLEIVLPFVDYAICSANFYPPQCKNSDQVFDFLLNQGIDQIAITQGEQPIKYLISGTKSTLPVPSIKAVDTLGAGDIFHGAFCHYILESDFATALTLAAQVASKSCQFFGTRSWMKQN